MSKHIVLIGLPGSGKSTMGKKMADKHQMPFVDLDSYIEQKLQMTIKTIFDQYGEAHFRHVEWAAFNELLNNPSSYIAVGGGLVSHAVTQGYEKPTEAYCIFLNPPISRLYEHLNKPEELAKRPLLTLNDAPLMARLEALKAEREAAYMAWTDEQWLNY